MTTFLVSNHKQNQTSHMQEYFERISTEELLEINDKNNCSIIDVRPVDAYNGWRMKNEKRGGHITGARSLPSKWAKYIDWIEIVRSKGIHPDQQIIIYGYSEDEVETVLKMFVRARFDKIKIYHLLKIIIKEDNNLKQ